MSDVAKTILFVDDHPDICKQYVRFLEGEGYKVECYSKVSPAVARIRQCGREHFACIVTDMEMPNKDGILTKNEGVKLVQVAAEYSEAGVIVLSAFSEPVREAMEAGAFSYSIKGEPEEYERLANSIRKAIELSEKKAERWKKQLAQRLTDIRDQMASIMDEIEARIQQNDAAMKELRKLLKR